jgi:hypothetical protein
MVEIEFNEAYEALVFYGLFASMGWKDCDPIYYFFLDIVCKD